MLANTIGKNRKKYGQQVLKKKGRESQTVSKGIKKEMVFMEVRFTTVKKLFRDRVMIAIWFPIKIIMTRREKTFAIITLLKSTITR